MDIYNNQWSLINRIQIIEMHEPKWNFQRSNSMKLLFDKTGEINVSFFEKISLRSSALLNIKNHDKYCLIWSTLDYLHPFENKSTRVSNYRHYVSELNVDGFDITYGFKCSHVHIFKKLNKLSINKFETNFYQDQNEWKRKISPY